jgi:epoxyqueuosine reductase
MADSRRVLGLAGELGFGLAGIASAEASGYGEVVREWIADGRHGEMGYLENNLETRLDPGKLVEGARSVICVADLYPAEAGLAPGGDEPYGRIARYAFGDDYHKTIKKRLHKLADTLAEEHPGEMFKSTVDTAPILEREVAARAGLGWIGKHTLLIHPRLGSYMLLGTIVTTLELATSEDGGYPGGYPVSTFPLVPATDHCGTCTRCIDACPTHCISDSGPRAVDARRCISYLTLEHRSEIEVGLHEKMGDWVAGCDMCQEVCPHNGVREPVFSNPPTHRAYAPRPPAPGIGLLEILNWTEEDRRGVLKGSALKRVKLGMFKRNALIAAGNYLAQQDDEALLVRIKQAAEDEAEVQMVRVTAGQVLARLGCGSGRDDP